MSSAKRVTIKLTAKQRTELKRVTGEAHDEVMVEALRTPLGSKSAPAAKLSVKGAPAAKLSVKGAPAAKLSVKGAPAAKLGVKGAPAAKLGRY
jgi:hypothetical protein